MARISDELRKAIKASGQTRYRIAQDTGISEPTLCRFMKGYGINTDTADILAKYLGLKLTSTSRAIRQKGK